MCVTLGILTLLSVIEQIAVRKITDQTLFETQSIIRHIRERRYEEAREMSQTLDEKWDRKAKWLEILVDHSSTDEVRYAFSKLIAALEERDSATAMIYACELEGAIEHVEERQALTLENIL